MKQFFELDMEVPSSDRNLVIDLPSWLKVAGKRSKVMIVLDALNQLDSGAGGSGKNINLDVSKKKKAVLFLYLFFIPLLYFEAQTEID